MHRRHHLGHPGQRVVVGVNHHVDTVTEHVEVTIGDQGSDLDQLVGGQLEAGHLAVDPHKSVVHRH